jgi:hypothetical protein
MSESDRVVWMKPTRHSPACKYTFRWRANKALSNCGMWVSRYSAAYVMGKPGTDACRLYSAGRSVKHTEVRP